MATVIFDFDSTVVSCETLEEVLKAKLTGPESLRHIQAITNQGMSGEIDFITSVEKRLSMASVSRKDFLAMAQQLESYLTPGMAELIAELHARHVDVWIVSGAVREVMLPVARRLGLPVNHVLGIELQWASDGNYIGIDPMLPCNRSKWEGAREASKGWSSPKIAVGDGITDYALYEHGLVDHFIAFIQHVRRAAVLDKGVQEAHSIKELRQCLFSHIQNTK